jgi:hypothetical protein
MAKSHRNILQWDYYFKAFQELSSAIPRQLAGSCSAKADQYWDFH